MQYNKLYLLMVLILVSCAAPETPAPTPTFTQEPIFPTSTVEVTSQTPDPATGSIQGNISWLDPATSTRLPVKTVNIELNGHSGSNPRYTAKTDSNGFYSFVNIEPIKYGFGIYFSIPISERRCDNPEFSYDVDLDWLHYATALKGELWFDIIFSNTDVAVKPGEVVVMDFVLKCP